MIVMASSAGRLARLAVPPKQANDGFRSFKSSLGPADLLWMRHDLLDHVAEVFRTTRVLAPVQVDDLLSSSSQSRIRLIQR